jgi:ergothioneine biosynthesis protein EgtB
MHTGSVTEAPDTAHAARCGDPIEIGAALAASRRDTLATFAAYQRALPALEVPQRAELNPPLWELGHIGWFQELWVARNPALLEGHRADPDAPPRAGLRADADALYDSSRIAHDSRWSLPLPDARTTRAELALQLEATLALLERSDGSDDALYFFRLALLHEDMHHEAALYMAQGLGIAIDDPRWQAPTLADPAAPVALAGGKWLLGSDFESGFAFDNELGPHEVGVGPTLVDAQPVRWAEYLPFAEAGGYADGKWWSDSGRAWLAASRVAAPRYLEREGRGEWRQWRHGAWRRLDCREPACHLTFHEAEAWCRWAGRRLPTEAEWERAAMTRPEAFRWGDVWEWTASAFAPYPGFAPHPYRDYSAPWFDGRPVLRGASFMTQPRMRHPKYRNFFPAHRNDVPAGFRSCAI